MRLLFLLLALLAVAPARAQSSPVGDWGGDLRFGGQSLRMVLHIAHAADTLAVTLDVPQQGGFAIPASGAETRADSLFVEYAAFGARFALAVAAPDSLHGVFSQGGAVLPIALTPAEPLRRPQTPVGPFPYAEEAVTIAAPGATLAGTFVRPAGAGPFPAVVFVSGSGPQDRDESLFGHKPFAVLADALARAGIASLRYDDRGTAASTGSFPTATMDTLVADAQAATAWLRARPGVGRVGVIGHSEGGITAYRLAPSVDFLVSLAGPAVRGDALYALQSERSARLAGLDSTQAALYGQATAAAIAPLLAQPAAPDSVLAPLMTRAMNEGLRPMSTAARTSLGLAGPTYADARERILGLYRSPWFRSFLAYDPAAALDAVAVPALLLYGGKDFQVPADQNAPAARARLADVSRAEVVVVDDANHLFQTATTGAAPEYGQIEETMAPATLARIVAWIQAAAR